MEKSWKLGQPVAPETKQRAGLPQKRDSKTHTSHSKCTGGKTFFFQQNEESLGVVPVPGTLAMGGDLVCEVRRGCMVAPCSQSFVTKVVPPCSSPPSVSASGPRRSKVG